MLDPWIIDEIRRREEEDREQPVLELPMDMPVYPNQDGTSSPQPGEERGVFIVDFRV
jgi:hypothetical protein